MDPIVAANGLHYTYTSGFGDPYAANGRQVALLERAIDAITFDFRRFISVQSGRASPAVVAFRFCDQATLLTKGGARAGPGGTVVTAPATPFTGGPAGGVGDLGVYYCATDPGLNGPTTSKTHEIWILDFIDQPPVFETNPLPVGGQRVFFDTVARCLGMAMTWWGGAGTPWARERLARIFGYSDGGYAYMNALRHGPCDWWRDSGAGDAYTGSGQFPPAILPWGSRITEACAETFKDAFMPRRLRAFTNRTAVGPPRGAAGWPLNTGGIDAFYEIYLDEMGTYVWGSDSAAANYHTSTGYNCGGAGPTGILAITTMSSRVYHLLGTGLARDFPPPILEIQPNHEHEHAAAELRGGYGMTLRAGGYFPAITEDPTVVKWVQIDVRQVSSTRPADATDSAIQVDFSGSFVSQVICDPEQKIGAIESGEKIAFDQDPYDLSGGAGSDVYLPGSYLRSRVICPTGARPVLANPGQVKVEGADSGRRPSPRRPVGRDMDAGSATPYIPDRPYSSSQAIHYEGFDNGRL